MLARAPGASAQGLHHYEPRSFNFPHFCILCVALRNLGLLVRTDCLFDSLLRTLAVCRRPQSESIEDALDMA